MDYYELIEKHPDLFRNQDARLVIITDREKIGAWQEQKRRELKKKGLPLDWAEIGVILDDPYILFIRDLVQFPDGSRRG
jgi:hypothetical protein